MYRLIYALRDDIHGVYGYTIEIVEKGVWRDLPLEEVRKNYTKIEGAYIEPKTQLVTAEGCRVVYVGFRFRQDNPKPPKCPHCSKELPFK